jgi:hypothetical protein
VQDEIDSGLDVDALRDVATAVNGLRTDNNAVLMITHYQRLLDYIQVRAPHRRVLTRAKGTCRTRDSDERLGAVPARLHSHHGGRQNRAHGRAGAGVAAGGGWLRGARQVGAGVAAGGGWLRGARQVGAGVAAGGGWLRGARQVGARRRARLCVWCERFTSFLILIARFHTLSLAGDADEAVTICAHALRAQG